MGLSDIPPPTTSCSLKRCRSEDPSLADPCSAPPPKLPFSHSPHHLSILQALESSLNGTPAVDASLTPEELVTEMMQSLEKVMADIEELIAPPCDPLSCAVVDALAGCGSSPTTSFACGRPGLAPNLCTDATAVDRGCDVPLDTMVHSSNPLDDCRGMASISTDAVSALEACTCDVSCEVASMTSLHGCDEMSARDSCSDFGSLEQYGLDAEQNDGQWSLLDELSDDFAASVMPINQIDWLEEGCDLPAVTLTQMEEEGLLRHATDYNTLLDCYL